MSDYIKILGAISVLLTIVISCNSGPKKAENNKQTSPEIVEKKDLTGNYVSDSYHQRNEGYDWIAVVVSNVNNDQIKISVRSRADKKEPSCTFDAKAFKRNDTTYESVYEWKRIIYHFTGEDITISTENQEDLNILYFFCNGGATLAGTYHKINEQLDPKQIDLTSFSKVLKLQGIGFNVSSIRENNKNKLSIYTFGLEEREYNETFNIEGEEVIDAEVEDLNSDGSPELFVYTQSVGSGSYGNVYAFSVNNKKSMSQVYFQPTAENSKINQGYMGHDEFTLIENSLGHRFPIYKEGDSNANPSGGIRQVSYKLVEGEAMRKLQVDKITEY